MIVIHGDISELNEFEWCDIHTAVKQFNKIRVKNKLPSFTFEGKTRIKIDVSITSAKHIHVNWRK